MDRAFPSSSLHKGDSKFSIRHHLIVPPTKTSEIGKIVGPTFGSWSDMIHLQLIPTRASSALVCVLALALRPSDHLVSERWSDSLSGYLRLCFAVDLGSGAEPIVGSAPR